jgi:hypothetical protein
MGFDVSFHPVDVELIQQRLLPYVEGQGTIDDLVLDAVRLAKVRYRAKAWALGLLHYQEAKAKGKPSKKTVPAMPADSPAFDSQLHLWGRPFFITVDRPDQVSRAIDHYLAAKPNEVDALAADMLRILDPELVDIVKPKQEGQLPEDAALAEHLRHEMDLFRECYQARGQKKKVRLPDGRLASPREMFRHHFPLAILSFAAQFRPGWMARGHVWPTCLLEELGLELPPYFTSPASLFKPILEKVPEIGRNLENTISANYMVGGYIPPDNASDLRIFLEEHLDKAKNPEYRVTYQKILEAVQDAEREHMGFAEASEIYSAPMGVLN